MCYDSKAIPPDAPGEAGAATGEDLELVSADGTHFAAFVARSGGEQRVRSQVLIYPDVRGLHGFYKELALRFAGKGIDAVAIDYFGRTAGLGPRDDSFEFMPHVQQMELPAFIADVRAALGYMKESAGGNRATFTLGFCMGGALSLLTGAEDLGLAGAIAFYAGMGRKFAGSEQTALERASAIRLPVLGLFGGADQGIPASMVAELEGALEIAGVEHKIVVYKGAPHSFFDRKAVEFKEASSDAWTQVLDFMEAHSSVAAEG